MGNAKPETTKNLLFKHCLLFSQKWVTYSSPVSPCIKTIVKLQYHYAEYVNLHDPTQMSDNKNKLKRNK